MKTIVAPVNFTVSSGNAARYAADMALAIRADLRLIHIVHVPVGTAEMPMTGYLFEEMQQSGADGLNELKEELLHRTEGKIRVFTAIETGAVGRQLEEFCAKHNPFVVIVGNSGHSLDRTLAGGNVANAIRRLAYPLIVVPPNAVFHQIGKVLLACDMEDIMRGIPSTVSFLSDLQNLFNTGFEVIHIGTGRQEWQIEAGASLQVSSWQERLCRACPEVHFVKEDNVEEGIREYMANHPADLLLVFPKKHSFFEFHRSHAKMIALHSSVPVMSIRQSGSNSNLLFS